ncbi:polysaccharide biosynthesis tyrosine autokinase [Flavobacteriaceae bacterium]|nr:polysaccharide biosynthesis tyrosine autokinase [Flavobacteriaceae bacterium]
MKEDFINNNNFQEENSLDIKKEISYYLFFWPWFIGFIVACLTGAFLYLRYEDRIYETTAQLQIKKEESDPSSFLTGGADLFGFDKVNTANSIALMNSNYILEKVVQKLDLQTKTFALGNIVGSLNSNLLFENSILGEIKFKEPDIDKLLEFEVYDNTLTINIGESIHTLKKEEILDTEDVFISPKDSLFQQNKSFKIIHTSLNNSVAQLRKNLTITEASKQGEIVNISFKGTNTKRNEAILNTLIAVLAEDQVADKREISKVSIAFIEERLKGLTESIDTISKNTIAYQMANGIYNPSTQTENALNNIITGQEEAFGLGIQIEIATALLEKLEAPSNFDILPANIGIENGSVNELVNSYNTVVTQRNNLLVSATEQSPVVLQLSRQLENAKAAIIKGVNRYIEGLEVSLSRYQQMESKTRGLVAGLPNKENTLKAYARSFKIVEELYVFLLQRKEEASISYISALPNLKILSYGVSSSSPISPKVQITYLAALLLGLIIPFGVLYLIKLLDTKINTRDDLEKGLNGITILGEVPFDEDIEGKSDERGIIAESTRVLRSSLSFLLKNQNSHAITVTSTTKGEGKSFVSFNIADSFRALGKKVILVGADLRNPQLHNRLGIERSSMGLSTYLSDESFNDIDTLITKGEGSNPMHFLLSGAIPPNPSELLMRPRMKELVEKLKSNYDFVIIDSAPLLLVSDTTALLPISDLVMYVCRAQYSDKDIFPYIKDLQNRPNIPPFGMVLNGLIAGPMSGYNYKYGYRYSYRYRYSYSYKYNYGYGYGYGADKE